MAYTLHMERTDGTVDPAFHSFPTKAAAIRVAKVIAKSPSFDANRLIVNDCNEMTVKVFALSGAEAVNRPVVTSQGKTVIEYADGEFQVMHPDGSVRIATSKRDAERFAKDWYRKSLGSGSGIGLGEIEWR